MQFSQDLYEREKARPERVNFRTGGGWRHSLEVVFQCAFVGIFEDNIMSPIVRKAAIEAYDAEK